MREFINIVETAINEVDLIPDFDDEINASRKFGRWAEEVKTAKTIGKIDDKTVKSVHAPQYGATIYFVMDGNNPIGRASVAQTPDGYSRVKHVWFNPAYRGKGYGLRLYGMWLEQGQKIISDYEHTRQSKALWERLAQKYVVRPVYVNDEIGDPVIDLDPFYGNGTMLLATKD